MMKLTALYNHPVDEAAFEAYYKNTHMPRAFKMGNVAKIETTKFVAGPDGVKPAFYRMAEIYFLNPDKMQAALSSPESDVVVADL